MRMRGAKGKAKTAALLLNPAFPHRDGKRAVAVALKQLRIPETDCVILYESQDRHTLRNENKRPFVE